MNQVKALKEKLRQRFRSQRLSLSAYDYKIKSDSICDLLLGLKGVEEANIIHVYWPLTEKREVDTRKFIKKIWSKNKLANIDGTDQQLIVMPVVTSFKDRPIMEHRLVQDQTGLMPNRWGILEPTGGIAFQPDQIDVVIVPAFGAGLNGHRIGHGRGYYDNFLHQTNAIKIGLVFESCLIDIVPAENHDILLNMIITPDKINSI